MPEVRFGPYTLIKRIAVGGMAEVYLARLGEGAKEEKVVVKQILPQLAEEPDLLQLFFDEARIASRVVHPGIVRIIDVGEHDGVHFLAMEYVDGLDLSQLMRLARDMTPEKGFPLHAAVRIAVDLSRALQHVHDATEPDGTPLEIVHRDVSPQNVLISKTGEVKLGDFGIARARIRAKKTATGVLRGKIAYVSPEQYLGQRGDRRVDVYAIGVVLFELCAGRRPFAGDEAIMIREVMTADAPSLAGIVPGIDVRLSSIIALALARKPEERIPTAGALAEALEAIGIARGRESVAELVQRALAFRDRGRAGADGGGPKPTQTLPGPRSSENAKPIAPPQPPPHPTETLPRVGALSDAEETLIHEQVKDPDEGKQEARAALLQLADTVPMPAAVEPIEEPETVAVEPPKGATMLLSAPVILKKTFWSTRNIFLVIVAVGFTGGWIFSSLSPAPSKKPLAATRTIAPVATPTVAKAQEEANADVAEAPEGDYEEQEPDQSSAKTKRPAIAKKRKPPRKTRESTPVFIPEPQNVRAQTESVREGFGELSLDSEPWSYVHVGKLDLGVTPLANVKLPAGRHKVFLENPERGMSRAITLIIKADEQLAVRVRLEDGRVQRR